MSDRIKTEIHSGVEILVIDFSGCKEDQMIAMLIEFRNMVIAGNKPVMMLGILDHKNYLTPRFMQAFRKGRRNEVTPFVMKQAVVGLSETKKMILKGYNLFFNRDIRAFDTKELAIQYLIND